MTHQIKIAACWLLIAVGFILHNLLELPFEGELPMSAQIFISITLVGTLLISLLTLHVQGKAFRWFSVIWSGVMLLLNAAHVVEQVVKEPGVISQVTLLIFILTANVLLFVNTWKWIKDR